MFIDLDDREYRETSFFLKKKKKRTEKVGTVQEAAMPCKLNTYQYRETCEGSEHQTSKHAS